MARKKYSRRCNFSPDKWKFLFAALIILTLIAVGLKCAHSCRRTGGPSSPAPQSTLGVLHYPQLEIAREIDASRRPNSLLKEYTGFTVMFNPENHTPDWVGWELLRSEANGDISRSNRFWCDESLPGCAITDDYRNAGYDRGHLCPAADQKWSAEAMEDCFSLANIAPQDHSLNSGAWSTLEKKERQWAERDSALVIIAGPVYNDSDTSVIGKTGVRVPSAFFKVLLAPYVEKPRAIGFLYPNMKASGNMEDYALTVDEVEKITGLDFFSALPDSIEDYVESHKLFKEWNQLQ